MFLVIVGVLPAAKNLMEGKVILEEWGVLTFAALFFVKNKWLKAWMLWLIACLIMQYNKYSYMEMNTIFVHLVFFQVLSDNLTDKRINTVLNGIAIVALVHIAFMIMQNFDIWYFYVLKPGYSGHITGTLGQNGTAGALVAVSIPAFLRKRWCWFLPIVIFGLILPRSMVAFVSGISGLWLYFIITRSKQKLLVVLALAYLVFAYFFIAERGLINGLTDRIAHWGRMWEVMQGNLVQGVGLGQFRVTFYVIDRLFLRVGSLQNVWKAHNEFIEMAYNVGIVGLGLMVGYIGSLINRFIRHRTELGFLAFIGIIITLITCLGHWTGHTSVFIIPVFYAAVIESQIKKRREA